MNQKLQKALELSEEILEDIELEKEKMSSVLLKTMRLARLINDEEAMQWLELEIGGYKADERNNLNEREYTIAKAHGREYVDRRTKNKGVFSNTINALEERKDAEFKSINNITTNGVSVAGDYANLAMISATDSAYRYKDDVMNNIHELSEKIGILKGEYYRYVLNVNMEIGFSKSSEDIFGSYRELVDSKLSNIIGDSEEKLSAIYDRLSEDNKESWSQAADTCRKLFKSVADGLFNKKYPNYGQATVRIKSGEDLDITGEKYVNRLMVCLDGVDRITKDHIEYVISWVKKLHGGICDGVHNDITFKEIQQLIIHTYICLGDILTYIN